MEFSVMSIDGAGLGMGMGTSFVPMDTTGDGMDVSMDSSGILGLDQGQGPTTPSSTTSSSAPFITIPEQVGPSSAAGTGPGHGLGSSGLTADNNPPSSPHPHTAGFQLSDLLTQIEDYQPTIPESLSLHFLHSAGFSSTDPRMPKLISLASQKFISDILNDCYTMCKLKGGGGSGGGGGGGAKKKVDKKFVLTVEDLVPVLSDYGITVKKPPYYL